MRWPTLQSAAALWMVGCILLVSLACTLQPLPTPEGVQINLPPATDLPAATDLPPATDLPAATSIQMATDLPAATNLPAATDLPAVTSLPIAPTLSEPGPTLQPDRPLVQIGDAIYRVDVAATGEDRAQGLSDRPTLAADEAMLFVYDTDAPRTFWMPNMHFPLDMVWIKSDCTVSGVTANVPNPEPETTHSDLPRYPSTEPVRFVLEINAGQAATNRITPGSLVKFDGSIGGKWAC